MTDMMSRPGGWAGSLGLRRGGRRSRLRPTDDADEGGHEEAHVLAPAEGAGDEADEEADDDDQMM